MNEQKENKQTIFEQWIETPKSTKRWFFIPMSMIFHGAIVAAVVILPLMSVGDEMPPVKVLNVYLSSASAPPPLPTPPRGKKGSDKPNKRQEQKKAPAQTDSLIEPVEIPTEIPDAAIDLGGNGSGDGGDVIGGVEGLEDGVIGSPFIGDQNFSPSDNTPIKVQMPRLIKQVKPDYPPVALRAHIQGVVVIEAVTDIYGRVVSAKVISGHSLLKQAALDAIRQWIYEPYILCGNPKPVQFTASVIFSLIQ
jgi:periplasmic protein TonB